MLRSHQAKATSLEWIQVSCIGLFTPSEIDFTFAYASFTPSESERESKCDIAFAFARMAS